MHSTKNKSLLNNKKKNTSFNQKLSCKAVQQGINNKLLALE